MDYVLGSVAALVTGNVTPNRPKLIKRALTPTKHQPSPNVTPKSEFVEDRSIFLSPSMQKKKAIVKKSPKRIFQNPDLDTTENGEGNLSLTSPKADKVKKHLKDDLESSKGIDNIPKSPKNKSKTECNAPADSSNVSVVMSNEYTPKKKKKKNNSMSEQSEQPAADQSEITSIEVMTPSKTPKKMKQRRKSTIENDNKENDSNEIVDQPVPVNVADKSPKKQKSPVTNAENMQEVKEITCEANSNINPKKKNKKRKKKPKTQPVEQKSEPTPNITEDTNEEKVENNQGTPKKKNRKRKKSKSQQNVPQAIETVQPASDNEEDDETDTTPRKKSKTEVNPNAITDKESDSEHESDDEIESENEEINKKVFESQPTADDSSDEDDVESKKEQPLKAKKEKGDKKEVPKEKSEIDIAGEIKRTLFVGNVPFSVKCKKEIKKIFSKHGQIQTIRIRTVPVKDGRYTPKLALIKNELHPERTTVNVYIKFAEEESVEKALVENNIVLNDHHLRVSRSSSTGAEHDPKCSIFVGNLPFSMEDEAFRQKFEKCGEIESVRIIRDKTTNAGKGFGYVNFVSKDGVELALALTDEDLTVKNRILRVKRCTQITNKQKEQGVSKKPFKQPYQGNQRMQGGQQGGQRQFQGGQRPSQGGQRQFQGGQRQFQDGQRQFQGGQRQFQGGQRQFQGGQRQFQGGQRGNQGGPRGNQGGQRFGNNDEVQDGAFRRLMNKRKNQEGNGAEGPPNKRSKDMNQPNKEKKSRKEFVGMTAEKKKKRKFDKGQKKKKALSEILTK